MNKPSHYRYGLTILGGTLFSLILGLQPARAQTAEQTAEDAARERQRSETWIRTQTLKAPARTKQKESDQPLLVHSEDILSAKQKKRLEPSDQDRQSYAAILRQPHTGIFKLLTAAGSGTVNVNDHSSVPLPLIGGGTYYSFTKRKHDLNDWAEIRWREGEIEAGFANLTMGFVTLLGDVPLEALNLNSPGVSNLAVFTPAADYDEANQQYRRSVYGFALDGFIYKSAQPVMVQQSYVLRSIRFGAADQVVVFRIVRQQLDGALTIVWKRLKNEIAPTLRGIPKSNYMASKK